MVIVLLIIVTCVCVYTGTKDTIPIWAGATEIILGAVCFGLFLVLISTDSSKEDLEFYAKQSAQIEQKLKKEIKHSSDDGETIQELYKEHLYCGNKISELESDQKAYEQAKWLLYFGKN